MKHHKQNENFGIITDEFLGLIITVFVYILTDDIESKYIRIPIDIFVPYLIMKIKNLY